MTVIFICRLYKPNYVYFCAGDSLAGQVLRILNQGDYTEAKEWLSQIEVQNTNLRGVCDSDGKTLLHLACCKNEVDWYPIIETLIDKYKCNVAAVDKDGNTPLHDGYQCGNKSVVEYLLSLPMCDPDVSNKHGVTVLKLALQINDIPTTRALLATGRVDPRRGSPRGHTYHEVMEMDGTLPQNIDDSALQIVTQCATCITNSNNAYQRYTFYYLLGVLRVIFKNRDRISIGGIIRSIKENNISLPEKPDEIHDLLIELSDEFEIYRGSATLVEEFEIRKKGNFYCA